MDQQREERLALNETLFRDVNGRLEVLEKQTPLGQSTFVCECARLSCQVKVEIHLDEYRAIREHPARFLVFPGHEMESIEEVVGGEPPRYLVVEKIGDGRRVAEERVDPPR